MKLNIFRRKKKTEQPEAVENITPEEINEIETEAINEDIDIATRLLYTQALKRCPLYAKMNYISNVLISNLDENINWDAVNAICTRDLNEFDYNMYKMSTTTEEFENQHFGVIAAYEGLGPWQKHACKDCGSTFYMTRKEVDFYKEKELHLPKRCKKCREKRKEGNI